MQINNFYLIPHWCYRLRAEIFSKTYDSRLVYLLLLLYGEKDEIKQNVLLLLLAAPTIVSSCAKREGEKEEEEKRHNVMQLCGVWEGKILIVYIALLILLFEAEIFTLFDNFHVTFSRSAMCCDYLLFIRIAALFLNANCMKMLRPRHKREKKFTWR